MASSFCDMDSRPLALALVGNPGAGKSTILNGIANESIFESGISLGAGLTTVLKEYTCADGKLTLFDTPGLADIEKRKQAGKEIDRMLQADMNIKLAFVITLEGGRVKPDDAVTIKVVLEAIKNVEVNDRFGVIINQLSPKVLEKLNEKKEEAARVRNGITGSFETSHWIYLPFLEDLHEVENGKLMTNELLTFFSGLPETKPADAEVEDIDTSVLEEKIEEQRRRIEELQEANEAQKQEMVRQLELHREQHEERTKEVQERLRVLEVELRRARQEAQTEKYKKNKILAGLWNATALVGGTVASIAVANPAPLIAATALCKTVKRPDNV